ncbi:hypothetical protein C2E23DRAFT_889333 [Lenzites betulinus]|nr:hypothetical protein C2E23DRAFT_889333 [Lenzites betulinus]
MLDDNDFQSSDTMSTGDGSDPQDEDMEIWDDIDDTTPGVELWVPGTFFDRLNQFLTYSDPMCARYNLGDIPPHCNWGPGGRGAHLQHENQVVQVWAVGHLKSMLFFAADEDPRPHVRISLDLVHEIDIVAVQRLMSMANVVPEEAPAIFHASSAPSGSDCLQIFRSLYDATTLFRAKHAMVQLNPSDIVIGDLVLVETRIERKAIGQQCRAWGTWEISFTLGAVSRLISRVVVKKETPEDTFRLTL